MGQMSSPISSKMGVSMNWLSSWDDKINFSLKLREDIFINMFLPLIFNQSQKSKNLLKFNKNYFFKNQLYKDSELKLKFLRFEAKFLKRKIFYFGKTFIMRYKNWLIVVFSVYLIKRSSYVKLRHKYFLLGNIARFTERYDAVAFYNQNINLNNFYKTNFINYY